MEAIKRDFGSFQKMKETMSSATVAVQGSGWGWLGFDKENGRLRIVACANQDPLQGTTGKNAIIIIIITQKVMQMKFEMVLIKVFPCPHLFFTLQ